MTSDTTSSVETPFVEWQKKIINLILSIIPPWNSPPFAYTTPMLDAFPSYLPVSFPSDAFVGSLLFCSSHKYQCSSLPLQQYSFSLGSLILISWWLPINVSSSFPSPIYLAGYQISPHGCFRYLIPKLLYGFLSPVIGNISQLGPQTHVLPFLIPKFHSLYTFNQLKNHTSHSLTHSAMC